MILAQDLTTAERFLPALSQASTSGLHRVPELEIARAGAIRVIYAPFDHIALRAKLVVVGITPGETQALNAIRAAQEALETDTATSEVLRAAKLTASFSGGVMRSNLVAMLDLIGVGELLGLRSCHDLFTPGGELVHLTSALRYPVFVNGENYNGTPDMLRTPILRTLIERHLAEEARLLPKALWLPLGPKPMQALRHLASLGLLDPARILEGLPHPSGANAERVSIFLGRKAMAQASSQTNGPALLASRDRLLSQIDRLKGVLA